MIVVFYDYKKKSKILNSLEEPEELIYADWSFEKYDQKVKFGVKSIIKHGELFIYEDGRGYELALDIKKKFILEHTKRLAEKIKITNLIEDGHNKIHISTRSI